MSKDARFFGLDNPSALPVHPVGCEVQSMLVWAPVAGSVTLGITAFSYRGALRVGVRADPRAIPDVEALSEAIDAELTQSYGGQAMASAL